MTLSTTTVRASVQGSGITGPFSFLFKIFAATDLLVQKTSATGVVSVLNYPTDYTVTGVGNASGGTLTLTIALAVGESLSILRAVPNTQPTSFRSLGTFFPASHEDEFDRLTMLVQQNTDAIKRSARIASSLDPAAIGMELTPSTGKVLGWASGTQLTNLSLDANAVAIPGNGRLTTTLSAYLANNVVFNIKDYGAVSDGGTDDTVAFRAAVQAAINAGGGPVRVPFGNTLVTGALTTIGTLAGGVWIEGDDKGGSLITFNPTVPNTILFNFDSGGGGALVWRSGIRNLKITSSNSVAKVGIRMLETRESFIEKVEVNFPSNDGSEALQLYGRDDLTIRDVVVYAPIPLHIKKNPYVGQQVGLDHATFYGLTLYQVCGSGQPLVTVDAGCHLSNVAFLGKTTLVGGNGWFLYDSSSDVLGGVFRLAFENIRWEHGGQTQTRPGCTIKPNGGNATRQGVSFRQGSVETAAGTGAGIGIQIRNVSGINLDDFSFNGASGLVGLDVDSSDDDLWYRDLRTPGGITHSITGLTQLMGAGFVTGGSPEQEKLGYWRASSHFGIDMYYGIGGDLHMPTIKQAIASGATLTLPVNSGSLGYAIVDVHTTKGTGSIESGQWRMNTDTADLSSVLDFGTTNVAGAAGSVPAGKIVVYRSVGDDTIKIKNGLAESRTFVIRFRMVK